MPKFVFLIIPSTMKYNIYKALTLDKILSAIGRRIKATGRIAQVMCKFYAILHKGFESSMYFGICKCSGPVAWPSG